MKKIFVMVLLVVLLFSTLTCKAESEPTMISSTITADTDLAKCDAADLLQPTQGELLFLSVAVDIIVGSPNLDTDKLMMGTNTVYIGYNYDTPSIVYLNYYNLDNESVFLSYDSECNVIAYKFVSMGLTPTLFDALGELVNDDLYDEWRELDIDVLESMVELVSTAMSEIG